MEDPKRCPKCGHNAVRVRRVNPKGREITSWPIWLFFGVSVLILMAHSSVHMACWKSFSILQFLVLY